MQEGLAVATAPDHETSTHNRSRRIIQVTAFVIAGGFIATFLSLFARPCYLSVAPPSQQDPSDIAASESVCRFGFPFGLIEEDRVDELVPGDDSRTVFYAFLGPTFDGSAIDVSEASLDLGFWSILLVIYMLALGPHLSQSGLKRSLRWAVAITVVLMLVWRSPAPVAPGIDVKIDAVRGWPVGWFVSEGSLGVPDGVLLDPHAYNLYAATLSVLLWWLALAFPASWRSERSSNG